MKRITMELLQIQFIFFIYKHIFGFFKLKCKKMKYTHNALTSITVLKVQNITTSMTRAGLGDDTYRRQREKERYLKCKQEQEDKMERKREQFMNEREERIKQAQGVTQKKSMKRQRKKELQKQRQKKMKLLKKLNDQEEASENSCSRQQWQQQKELKAEQMERQRHQQVGGSENEINQQKDQKKQECNQQGKDVIIKDPKQEQ